MKIIFGESEVKEEYTGCNLRGSSVVRGSDISVPIDLTPMNVQRFSLVQKLFDLL